MKISYRTNPIINLLEKKDGGFRVFEYDRVQFLGVKSEILNFIDEKAEELRSNVSIVTQPFADAFEKASEKLLDAMHEGKIEVIFETGVQIYKSRTYLYSVKPEGISVLVFDKDYLTAFIKSDNKKNNKTFLTAEFPSDNESYYLTYLLLTIWFKKYCDIDVKFLGAGKKAKDINCKYINDTKTNVTILDSTWFTTIVKTEGFAVRGHFRLQACGKDMQERKLIWINDFEKNGYTRHFKRPVTLDEFTNN